MLTPAQSHQKKVVEQGPWRTVRNAERTYARSLRAIARHCCEMIKDVPPQQAMGMLHRYSEIIHPWAELTAARMVSDVVRRDLTAWTRKSKEMGRPLAVQARMIFTGDVARELINEQMNVIVQFPLSAAQKLSEGHSADAVGDWLVNRAEGLSRSQVARAATAVVKLRSSYLGSEGYIWRTTQDSRVRPRHRSLEGKFFRWTDPPIVDDKGMRGHPGDADGCRCIPEPVVGEYR